jgi:hypothetical protein
MQLQYQQWQQTKRCGSGRHEFRPDSPDGRLTHGIERRFNLDAPKPWGSAHPLEG